jgi:putative NADH-flavin reductase
MAWQQPKGAFTKGRILPGSPIAESVERRSREVGALLRARRKLALAFKRTRSEADRAELREMDDVLAEHRIDIPAIAERLAVKRT